MIAFKFNGIFYAFLIAGFFLLVVSNTGVAGINMFLPVPEVCFQQSIVQCSSISIPKHHTIPFKTVISFFLAKSEKHSNDSFPWSTKQDCKFCYEECI